jgi:small GTP-binding protein
MKHKFKLVLLGDTNVGKSSLAIRMSKNKFIDKLEPSIGAAFMQMTRHDITLDIWDTAGQERFKSLIPMYYRNADIALVVYDVTNKDSYDTALKWIVELNIHNDNTIIILVGNKIDLPNKDLCCYDAEFYSRYNNILYIDVSAKTGTSINELIELMYSKLLKLKELKKELKLKKEIELLKNKNNFNLNCCY